MQKLLSVTLLSLAVFSASAIAETIKGTDDAAQLPFWEWRDKSVSIRLVQRLPDQSRGYFEARGFSKNESELIANSCVFQTVYKNISPAGSSNIIIYDLSQWHVHVNGNKSSMKLREYWEKEWVRLKVSTKAKIAFKWSLLPTQQTYKPQDFNWGMSVFGLKPGTRFDLEMKWSINGKKITQWMKGLECAPDVHLDPKDPFG